MEKTKYEAAVAAAQEARKETWIKRAADRAAGKSQREHESLTKAESATK